MLYQQGTFTCPASWNTSQKKWDLSFLSKEEFIEKYSISDQEYKELVVNGVQD